MHTLLDAFVDDSTFGCFIHIEKIFVDDLGAISRRRLHKYANSSDYKAIVFCLFIMHTKLDFIRTKLDLQMMMKRFLNF